MTIALLDIKQSDILIPSKHNWPLSKIMGFLPWPAYDGHVQDWLNFALVKLFSPEDL